jgi:hypothetical protein
MRGVKRPPSTARDVRTQPHEPWFSPPMTTLRTHGSLPVFRS